MNTPPSANPFRASRLNSEVDYRPEWEVTSLNDRVVKALVEEVHRSQGRDTPNPEQMIAVILAAPGYGKTHIFGRIAHELKSDVFFVYVPGFEDLNRPLEHIRWHAVESLFRALPGKPSALTHALARLCQASLLEYVGRFPASLAARFQGLALGLQEDPDRAQEIVTSVKELTPFLRLASSIADRTPHIPRDVIRALALGWSPVAHLARRWLKGENLPEEERGQLGFEEEPPQPLDVLQGISAIFQYRVPMILCCDQLEFLTTASADLTNQVTARLMSILEKVPNQVLILSCLRTEWIDVVKAKAFQSFLQRLRQPELVLDPLKEQQALQLVANRMKGVLAPPSSATAVWPFDESALLAYVQKTRPTPRALIQQCDRALEEWLKNAQQELIYLKDDREEDDLAKQFQQLWNSELDKIRSDPACEPEEYSEDRLYRGVREALNLARESLRDMGGVRIKNVQENVLRQSGKDKRYALAVDVTTSGGSGEVVVPVTVLNNARKLVYYVKDLLGRLEPAATVGALLVHRNSEFDMGERTRDLFDRAVGQGRLRVFALEENPQTLQRLECLLRFLGRAIGQELQVGGQTLTVKQCQAYVLETAVLDNLELFKALGAWRKLQPGPKASATPKPPPSTAEVAGVEKVVVAAGATTALRGDNGASDPGATTPSPQREPEHPFLTASVGGSAPTHEGSDSSSFQAKYEAWAREKLALLARKLTQWGQSVQPDGVEVGAAFARLRVLPSGSRTTINRIRDKAEDLKIHLGMDVEPLIGSQASHISVDVQLPERRTVTLDETLADSSPLAPGAPVFPAGMDVSGKVHWLDLSDTSDCHLLIAGQTGSGKSEFLRVLLAGLARRLDHEHLQFVLIDPKRVTFNLGMLESPYLHFPIALDPEGSLPLLQWALDETRRRYDLLAQQKKSNVAELEDQTLIPRIVVVIDEFATLLEDKETKPALTALLRQIGATARAAGIHLVLATQRPDKDVITPLLKSNLPGRVALQVSNEANSKLILGSAEAAYLLGKGDLLWQHRGALLRLQSPFITQSELEKALRAH